MNLKTFLKFLLKITRLSELLEVIRVFETVSSRDSGFMTGMVDSAIELTDLEKSEVKRTIEERLSCPVWLQFRVCPD